MSEEIKNEAVELSDSELNQVSGGANGDVVIKGQTYGVVYFNGQRLLCSKCDSVAFGNCFHKDKNNGCSNFDRKVDDDTHRCFNCYNLGKG